MRKDQLLYYVTSILDKMFDGAIFTLFSTNIFHKCYNYCFSLLNLLICQEANSSQNNKLEQDAIKRHFKQINKKVN